MSQPVDNICLQARPVQPGQNVKPLNVIFYSPNIIMPKEHWICIVQISVYGIPTVRSVERFLNFVLRILPAQVGGDGGADGGAGAQHSHRGQVRPAVVCRAQHTLVRQR